MIVDLPDLTKEQTEEFTKDRIRPSFIAYLNNVGNAINEFRCVEIGTSTGVNAVTMLKIAPINLVVVDPYLDNQHEEAVMRSRLDPYKDRVRIIIDKSSNAVHEFEDNYFDYVYIDGNHDKEYIKEDLELWYPKVKPYGVLAGHDFNMHSVFTEVISFGKKIRRRVFGVNQFCDIDIPKAWNLDQMCDWWIWVDK